MSKMPVWWSFGSCPRHISLGAGAPPNGWGNGVASAAVVEELQPFFAVHAGATKTSSVALALHKEPSIKSPPKRAQNVPVCMYTNKSEALPNGIKMYQYVRIPIRARTNREAMQENLKGKHAYTLIKQHRLP